MIENVKWAFFKTSLHSYLYLMAMVGMCEKLFVKPTLLCVSTSEYQIYLNAIKGVTVSFAETSILIVWKRAVLYSFHCRLYYAEFKGNTC